MSLRRSLALLVLTWLGSACGGDGGRRMSQPEAEPSIARPREPVGADRSVPSVGEQRTGAAGSNAAPAMMPVMTGRTDDANEPQPALPKHRPPAPDQPLAAPDCGREFAPGETRAVIEGVLGRVAIDEHGNAYAPTRNEAGELALTAFDPCAQPLWQRAVAPQLPEHSVAARLPGEDEVVLDALANFRWDETSWRFDRSGEPLAPYAPRGDAYGWVAATADGVFLSTYDGESSFLSLLKRGGGEQRTAVDRPQPEWTIEVSEQECATFGRVVGCYSAAFAADDGALTWSANSGQLIEGTHRSVVSPASDGERLYSLVSGRWSYRLVATSLATGETLWSRELGPAPEGNEGVSTGAPVIGPDGLVYAYFAYSTMRVTREVGDIIETVVPSEHFGWLIAFDRDGEERWRFEAPHDGFSQRGEHATHLVGSDGAVYLATARGVFALDAQSGALRWQRSQGLFRLWTPRLALSPNGDLLVQLDDEQLMYIATEAHGTADSPWPAPGGDRRNLNAR